MVILNSNYQSGESPVLKSLYWLVVYLPSWKMMEFVNGKGYPRYEMENKTCSKPPTKYIYIYIWVWVNTYRYICSGMNIHLPAILMFTRGTRFRHTAIYKWLSSIAVLWPKSKSLKRWPSQNSHLEASKCRYSAAVLNRGLLPRIRSSFRTEFWDPVSSKVAKSWEKHGKILEHPLHILNK